MGKPRGFIEFPRREAPHRPVAERLRDFDPVELRLSEDEARDQAARCMDCGVPFCQGCGCPLAGAIPEVNDLVYRGRWQDALDILLAANPFPEFTGRLCPALCEGSCVLGIHGEPVNNRQIELAVVERGFAQGYLRPEPPAVRRTVKAAVIGSGPAGLAAADTLNRAGYAVTVFDEAARPGGILRYGIPDFKLAKGVLDRRLQMLAEEGIVFETKVQVGADLSSRYLQGRYAGMCFCGGARAPRDLRVPGRELGGIHFAMDYLVRQNKRLTGEANDPAGELSAAGKRVVILGGGDTGADCLGTALRQAALSVTQLEILPEPPAARSPDTPWPMWPHKRRDSSSHHEGGARRWGVTTRAFKGASGRVCALQCVAVEWDKDDTGRPRMRTQAGSEFEVAADLVLLALGFAGPQPNRVLDDLGAEKDSRGLVRRNADGMTTVPGVFIAGDMYLGPSLMVRAMADGRRVGEGLARYLDGV